VYTNGPRIHAERVTEARGLKGAFDAIYGVEHAAFHPKPERIAYETVFALDGLDPARAAMFEDDPRNLMEPARMGLRCVLVGDEAMAPADHIHHRTRDLAHFLAQVSG
ncbi:MAG: HAD family hydrolase, partial [Paracoccaceae bacterium]